MKNCKGLVVWFQLSTSSSQITLLLASINLLLIQDLATTAAWGEHCWTFLHGTHQMGKDIWSPCHWMQLLQRIADQTVSTIRLWSYRMALWFFTTAPVPSSTMSSKPCRSLYTATAWETCLGIRWRRGQSLSFAHSSKQWPDGDLLYIVTFSFKSPPPFLMRAARVQQNRVFGITTSSEDWRCQTRWAVFSFCEETAHHFSSIF